MMEPLKKAPIAETLSEPPKRGKITREEALKHMKEFDQRKKAFIAAIRKGSR
jgi:hypothetical protein